MTVTILKLLAARDPLPHIEFPNGKVFAVRESDGFLEQLLEDAAREKSGEKFEQAWQYLVPDATPDDWKFMVTQDYARLLDHARQNTKAALEFVETNRKNESGGIREPERAIPPSKPIEASSTSSLGSPEPSGATTSSSAENRTGKPSSRTTDSRKPSGSTTSSPTSMP